MASIRRRLAHLQQHGAPSNAHLDVAFNGKFWSTVYSADITADLRATTKIIGAHVGLTPKDITARSIQAGGDMVLLMAHLTET